MTREFVQPGSKIVPAGHLTGKELVQIVRGSAQETQTTTAAIAALGGAGIAIAGGVGSIPGVTSVTFSGATVTGTTPNATVVFPLTVQDVDDDVVTGVTSITFAGATVSGTTPDAVVTILGGGLGTGTAPVLQQTADQVRSTDESGRAVLNLLADDGLPSGDQGGSSALELDAFGGGVPGSIIFGAARGVVGAPAALQSDDGISLIQYFGHDGASYSSPVVQEIVTAAENFDNTHHAASWSLSTVSLGADDEILGLTPKLGIDGNGAVVAGTPSGPAASPGDVNIAGQFKIDGVAIGGGFPSVVPPIATDTLAYQPIALDTFDDVINLLPNVGNTGASILELDSYTGVSQVIYSGARGVRGTPTHLQTSGYLGQVQFFGYGDTTYKQGGIEYIQASEDWTDTHFPIYWKWFSQSADDTFNLRFWVDDNGAFNIGNTTGPAPVYGDVNITKDFKKNGIPITGSGTATAVAGAATLNKQNGTVTSEALVAATTYTLTLTNSVILSTSTVMVNLYTSAGSSWFVTGKTVSAGQVVITMATLVGSITGTIFIDFAVFN